MVYFSISTLVTIFPVATSGARERPLGFARYVSDFAASPPRFGPYLTNLHS